MKRRWKEIALAFLVVLVGAAFWFESAWTPRPYLASRLAVVVPDREPALTQWVDDKKRIIYVWAPYEVIACVCPRASWGYDCVDIVRTPNGKTYDRVMEQRFVFPRHGAVEAVSGRVVEESEIPDFLRELLHDSE